MLKEREQIVLKEIIDSYVATAVPVGSQTVARRLGLGLSPATIRNTMMDLEDRGYLAQPHTSAGRIPTDLAYRTWVDGWLFPEPPGSEEQRQLDDEFDRTPAELASLLDEAARLIGGACRQVGVALSPSIAESIVTGIEFVRVAEQRVLVVLRLRDGLVRTVLLDVATRLDAEALAHTAARLNEHLVGLSLDEIRRTMAERVRDWGFRNDEVITRLIALGPRLFQVGGPAALYVSGASEIVAQPEFQSPQRLRELLRVVEDRFELTHLLHRRTAGGGITITIGHENPAGPLTATSIVTASWRSGGLQGTLGVIGPTRMSYPRVIGILHNMVRQLDRRLNS